MKVAKHAMLILFLGISGQIFAQEDDRFTAYDLFRMDLVLEAVISPDGNEVAYTVNVERPFEEGKGPDYRELYVLDIKSGESRPILDGKNRVWSLSWRPGGEEITFLADLEKEKKNQLYSIAASGGEPSKVFDSEKSILQYEWNPVENSIAFVATTGGKETKDTMREYGFDAEVFEENVPFRSIFIHHIETEITSQLTANSAVFDLAWCQLLIRSSSIQSLNKSKMILFS